MDTSNSFGYWVRRRRKALDLTQEELAERVGCAVITLRKIEADERRPYRARWPNGPAMPGAIRRRIDSISRCGYWRPTNFPVEATHGSWQQAITQRSPCTYYPFGWTN